jgi:uncharacterized protein YndB with AHSA1/START domain
VLYFWFLPCLCSIVCILDTASRNLTQHSEENAIDSAKLYPTSRAIIHVSVRVDCDADQAFKMFTRNKSLEAWLTTRAEVESRVGGKYELFWNPSDKLNDSTIGCKVTTFLEPLCLSFTWKGPKEYKHFMNEVDPLTHVTVFFIPLSHVSRQACTDIYLIDSGSRESTEWQEAREYFVRNWLNAFKELQRKCRNSGDALT